MHWQKSGLDIRTCASATWHQRLWAGLFLISFSLVFQIIFLKSISTGQTSNEFPALRQCKTLCVMLASIFLMLYLKSIEFIFSFTYRKYQTWGEQSIPGVYALSVISTIQMFNILTLIFIGSFFDIISIDFKLKYYLIFTTFLTLFMNYYYLYKIKKPTVVVQTYTDINQDTLVAKRAALTYVICSAILFLSCFIYHLRS